MKISHAVLGAFMLVWSATCFAQIDQGNFLSATTADKTTANFFFAKPSELTIIVNLIGFVQRPGRYEISNTIDLPNLIALAGGPTPDGALDDIEIIRIVRTDSRFERREFTVDLEKLTKLRSDEFALQPGDFIRVKRTNWSIVRDSFGVLATAAILTTAAVSVYDAAKK